jgi:hypothetical protein
MLSRFWESYLSGMIAIPAVERVAEGEITMISEKSIYIKESDSFGNLKMIGAALPVDLVAALCRHISIFGKNG